MGGKVNIDLGLDFNPSPKARLIHKLWTYQCQKVKLMRNYSRQINNTMGLSSFTNNSIQPEHGSYNPTIRFQGSLFMKFGFLYTTRESRPK